MKKKQRKALRQELVLAIKKQLLENNVDLSNKFEKTIDKSIKNIVRKASVKKIKDAKSTTIAPVTGKNRLLKSKRKDKLSSSVLKQK